MIFQSHFLSALQCRLDCHAGYVAHKTPIITCVKGSYQPQAPNTFVCAPAVALLLSTSGEVEVFSKNEKCNQKILEFPSFGGQGRSLDLLDEQLILLGAVKAGRSFEYKSIHQPRKGLLGMRFSQEVSSVGNNPFWHTSHSYGNQLLAIGGEFRSKAGLASGVWNGLNLRWQNGSSFYRFAAGACKVKLARDVFFLIGGVEIIKGANVVMNTMLRLNITEEKVEELPSIKKGRAFHSCEILFVDDRMCLEEPLPPHSCPTLDGGTCVFPFRNGNNKVFQLVSVHLHHQDLKPIPPVLKSRTTDIGV